MSNIFERLFSHFHSKPAVNMDHINQLSEKYMKYDASNSDSGTVLSDGIQVLYMFLDLLGNRGKTEFSKLQQKANVSRDSQEQANALDTAIAECNKQKDPNKATYKVPDSAIEFMRKINLLVNNKTIDQYLKDNANANNELDKGKLTAIKAALETHSARASDFVSQSQLKIQNTMQTYNVTTTLINSLQSMLSEMNKMIAQNIR